MRSAILLAAATLFALTSASHDTFGRMKRHAGLVARVAAPISDDDLAQAPISISKEERQRRALHHADMQARAQSVGGSSAIDRRNILARYLAARAGTTTTTTTTTTVRSTKFVTVKPSSSHKTTKTTSSSKRPVTTTTTTVTTHRTTTVTVRPTTTKKTSSTKSSSSSSSSTRTSTSPSASPTAFNLVSSSYPDTTCPQQKISTWVLSSSTVWPRTYDLLDCLYGDSGSSQTYTCSYTGAGALIDGSAANCTTQASARSGNGPYCRTQCPRGGSLFLDAEYTHAVITTSASTPSYLRCSYALNNTVSDSTYCDYSVLNGALLDSGNYDGSSTPSCAAMPGGANAAGNCLDRYNGVTA